MKLGALATHLAELPQFGTTILDTNELDFATAGWAPKTFESNARRVEEFDRNAAGLTAGVESATWESLDKPWVLRAGDAIYVNDQKARLLRSFVISHIAHHRAQLGIYLRLLGIAIPGTYGPS